MEIDALVVANRLLLVVLHLDEEAEVRLDINALRNGSRLDDHARNVFLGELHGFVIHLHFDLVLVPRSMCLLSTNQFIFLLADSLWSTTFMDTCDAWSQFHLYWSIF
jgi:hypothetical protein